MFYVIKDDGILSARDIKTLNKKSDMQFTKEDFRSFGPDYLIQLNENDISFLQDAKKLSNIALNKLFKQDLVPKLLIYVVLTLQVLVLFKK